MNSIKYSNIRWGLGLRPHHFDAWQNYSEVPVLELMTDNLIDHEGGPALFLTERLASKTQVVAHGIGLNLGGTEPLDEQYLKGIVRMCKRFRPEIVSDHLCFTRSAGYSSYELLPLCRNNRTLELITSRIQFVQEWIGQPLALENISSYISFRQDSYSEGEFMAEIVKRSGCGVLLDLNNLVVNASNFEFSEQDELLKYPLQSVRQLHIAGHSKQDDYLFDTHDQAVSDRVVKLTASFLANFSGAPTLPVILEWDDTRTPLADVWKELQSFKSRLIEIKPASPISENQPTHRIQTLPVAQAEPVQVQNIMVSWVQGRSEVGDLEILKSNLNSQTLHRLEAYRKSYLGRVLSVLGKTILGPVEQIFGFQAVHELLQLYYHSRPPTEIMIADSLRDLPNFIHSNFEECHSRDLLEGLVQSCINSWNLMKGADPMDSPPQIGTVDSKNQFALTLISQSCLIVAKGTSDLYSAWIHPEHQPIDPTLFCLKLARSLLLVKTTARTLVALPVVQPLIPLIQKLTDGIPLGKLLEELEEATLNVFPINDWQELISQLAQNHCWKVFT